VSRSAHIDALEHIQRCLGRFTRDVWCCVWGRASQRDRLLLWGVVVFACGIALYFQWGEEPARMHLVCVTACGVLLMLVACYALLPEPLRVTLWACAALTLGFSCAVWRTQYVATPMIQRPVSGIELRGQIKDLQGLYTKKHQGISGMSCLLEVQQSVWRWREKQHGVRPLPRLKRVKLLVWQGWQTLQEGQHIRLGARLTPIAHKTWPQGYDARRRAYFEGVSASGFALEAPRPWARPPPLAWPTSARAARVKAACAAGLGYVRGLLDVLEHRIQQSRRHFGEALLACMPMPEGAVANALTTGHTHFLPQAVRQDFSNAGIAHLLAISGLHLSIIAGVLFFVCGRLLLFVPGIALRWPIHKIAALLSMVGLLFYLLFSGAHIPAQRAFLMTGGVMLGVLVDRSAVTLRLVALAALGLLLVHPEVLVTASFQLSFAAVIALVASAEVLWPWVKRVQSRVSWGHNLLLWVGLSFLSSLVASFATMPFTIVHFNQVTWHGVWVNMLAVPWSTWIVMPLALLSYISWAVGVGFATVSGLFYRGLKPLTWLAHCVGSDSTSALSVPHSVAWAFPLVIVGGLWMCLWRGRVRALGAPLVGCGVWGLFIPSLPLVFVDSQAQTYGVFDAPKRTLWVSHPRRAKFAQHTWARACGAHAITPFPYDSCSAMDAPLRWQCGKTHCYVRAAVPQGTQCRETSDAVSILLAADARKVSLCAASDYVFSLEPMTFHPCRGRFGWCDRFSVWRSGAHCLWIMRNGHVLLESALQRDGRRPWSGYPPPWRPKKARDAQHHVPKKPPKKRSSPL
jgi:competence protein ComEC